MRLFVFSMMTFTILCCPVKAGESTQLWSEAQSELRVAMRSPFDSDPVRQSALAMPGPSFKNPKLAAFMSGFIPGSGQLYGKSWIRGLFFIGTEVALIIGYNHYRDEGDKLKVKFRAFADAHWIEADYWVAMAREAGIEGVTPDTYADYLEGEDGLREFERLHHSHQLHRVKDQQYYEMIGKYYQFEHGWDDFDPELHKVSPNRAYYEDLELKKDTEYKRAGTCGMIILANHLISAFDAAWTISRYNRSLEIRPQMSLIRTPCEFVPTTGFALSW